MFVAGAVEYKNFSTDFSAAGKTKSQPKLTHTYTQTHTYMYDHTHTHIHIEKVCRERDQKRYNSTIAHNLTILLQPPMRT